MPATLSTPVRFLIVGAFNFAFGYGLFALFWWLFGAAWPDWLIILVTTVLGITESFVAHRFVTYRSHGCWWREYLRFYVVYGVQTLVNMGVIRLFVTTFGWNAYAVQFATLVILTLVTYWAHKLYSFAPTRASSSNLRMGRRRSNATFHQKWDPPGFLSHTLTPEGSGPRRSGSSRR